MAAPTVTMHQLLEAGAHFGLIYPENFFVLEINKELRQEKEHHDRLRKILDEKKEKTKPVAFYGADVNGFEAETLAKVGRDPRI